MHMRAYIIANSPTETWCVLDSQNYLLPQRRHRVWGLVYLITGHDNASDVETAFKETLTALQSNFQFPTRLMFPQKPPQEPNNTRLESLVEIAKRKYPYSQNVIIDATSSEKWAIMADNVIPCLTPTHGYYSTGLGRFLEGEDFLNAQGLWKSAFNPTAYKALEELGQDIAGNSFSSTVCQAVLMTAMTCAPHSWQRVGVESHASSSTAMVGVENTASSAPPGVFRRLKRKQPCPDFPPPVLPDPKPTARGRGRARYKRKNPEQDGRSHNHKGKSKVATIWEKEQVPDPELFNSKHSVGWPTETTIRVRM